MDKRAIRIEYECYPDAASLAAPDRALLERAREATANAYAPYSRFRVSAVALLDDGTMIAGTNQENASFPAGLCAERAMLAAVAATKPNAFIVAMAVSYRSEAGPDAEPISPCGICRQTLAEWEIRQGNPLRLILGGARGPVYVLRDVESLLPLAFTSSNLGGHTPAV